MTEGASQQNEGRDYRSNQRFQNDEDRFVGEQSGGGYRGGYREGGRGREGNGNRGRGGRGGFSGRGGHNSRDATQQDEHGSEQPPTREYIEEHGADQRVYRGPRDRVHPHPRHDDPTRDVDGEQPQQNYPAENAPRYGGRGGGRGGYRDGGSRPHNQNARGYDGEGGADEDSGRFENLQPRENFSRRGGRGGGRNDGYGDRQQRPFQNNNRQQYQQETNDATEADGSAPQQTADEGQGSYERQPRQQQGGYHGGRGGYNNNNNSGRRFDSRRSDEPMVIRPLRDEHRESGPVEGGRRYQMPRGTQQDQPASNDGRPGRTMRAPRFRRNNFNEDEVLKLLESRHNQRGITFDNYESIAVEIVPNDIDAVTSFVGLGIEPALEENIRRCGYQKPTPVQKYGIPVCLAGRDLMACAQTGSGKTAAFLIPVIQHILVHGVSPAERRRSLPIALVMAPTRELALQIYDESRKLVLRTDVYCDVVYGGIPYPTFFEQDILVACPGRLKDIFDRESISFSRTKFLILDEADRMLEMGFEEQIEYLVHSSFTDMPPPEERQTLMFSATFPVPIRNLAQKYLRRHYYLLTVGRVGSTTKNITQRVMYVEESEKKKKVMELIFDSCQTDLVLIFVETKRSAEELFELLYDEGIPAGTIHSGRRQQEREEALRLFKDGKNPILVATDVASRGLDIPNVSHVIQYDLPRAMDDYTHRIGRTGRAGNEGLATSFFNDTNLNLCEELLSYLQEHDQEVPAWMEEMAEEKTVRSLVAQHNRGGRRGGGAGGNRGPRDHHDRAPRHDESREAQRPAPKPRVQVPLSRVADGGF